MKLTLAAGSGYLEIDHRNSPGLSPADVAHVPGMVAVGEGQHFERDVQQCSHCQRTIVLNPGRVRDRAVCFKCHHYICDDCEAIRVKSGACVPMKQVFDEVATHLERFRGFEDHPDADPVILLTDR